MEDSPNKHTWSGKILETDIEESQFGYLPVFVEGCDNQQYNLGIRLNATLEDAKKTAQQILSNQRVAKEYQSTETQAALRHWKQFVADLNNPNLQKLTFTYQELRKLQQQANQHTQLVKAIQDITDKFSGLYSLIISGNARQTHIEREAELVKLQLQNLLESTKNDWFDTNIGKPVDKRPTKRTD